MKKTIAAPARRQRASTPASRRALGRIPGGGSSGGIISAALFPRRYFRDCHARRHNITPGGPGVIPDITPGGPGVSPGGTSGIIP